MNNKQMTTEYEQFLIESVLQGDEDLRNGRIASAEQVRLSVMEEIVKVAKEHEQRVA